MFTFIYHQFFITLIATLDDYFSQILLLILQAYPEKLGDKIFKLETQFSNVNNILSTTDIFSMLGVSKEQNIIKLLLDEQIIHHVRELMYSTPLKYINKILLILGDNKLIRLEKLIYSEMCLRRNAGVHSGWVGNQEYNFKIEEIIKGDTGNKLNLSYNSTKFLGFDKDYFEQAYNTSKTIIITLNRHCENKFAKQDTN